MASFYDSLTENQKLYSMYFIAKYESSWSWDGNNYNNNVKYGDPFTLGIMQWAGGNCYRFLLYVKSESPTLYSALPQTWRDAVDEGAGAPLWGGYSMTSDDVETWSAAIADNLEEAKRVQQLAWLGTESGTESLESELDALDSWGTLPEDPTLEQIRVVYFYLARYHNCGTNMRTIYNQYGWDSSLEEVRDATLAMYRTFSGWGTYGAGWTNAINDNYDLLSSWDGDAVPDFGQVAGYGSGTGINSGASTTGGGTTSSVIDWSVGVSFISTNNETLFLHLKNSTTVPCIRAMGNNVWLPQTKNGVIQSGSTSSDDQQSGAATGDTPTTPGDYSWFTPILEKIVSENQAYGYSISSNIDYNNPDSSGYTNCSAYITYLARRVYPNGTMAGVYSYTGSMATVGERVAKGTSWDDFPYPSAQPGDVLLVNWYYDNADYDHVELFCGTTSQGNASGSELWGAGSAPAPHKSGDASAYVKYTYNWELRRIPWTS